MFSFLPLASPGKVFFSRLVEKGFSFLDASGWRKIYRAEMILNGGRLDLSVYGCDEPLGQVAAKLKQALNSLKEKYFVENDASAQMAGIADDLIARALAVALPAMGKTVIFSTAQAMLESSKSASVPAGSDSFGGFLLPGSSLRTTIKNADTGAALETRLSFASPENALNTIGDNLTRKGWKIIYPAGAGGASGRNLMVFQRSAELCVVSAGAAARAGQAAAPAGEALHEARTCVTILTKKF